MSAEVIANLWTFVKMGFAYEVGVRLYMVPGNDDEKFAFLHALAPFDFHFAQRFPIPGNFKVTFVDAGRSKEFSGLVQPIPDEHLDCFRHTWDPLQESLPEHKIGTSGTATARAPLETSNLLNVHTYVEVRDDRQVAQIPNPEVSGQQPKLLLNRWAFADAGSPHVFSLAGRAYLAVGNAAQLDRILSMLAPDDYFLSRRIPIPSSGGAVETSAALSQQSLFDEVLRDIEQNVPLGRLDWLTETTTKYSFRPDEAKLKTSVVIENQQGKVSVAEPPAPQSNAPVPAKDRKSMTTAEKIAAARAKADAPAATAEATAAPQSHAPAPQSKKWWHFWKQTKSS